MGEDEIFEVIDVEMTHLAEGDNHSHGVLSTSAGRLVATGEGEVKKMSLHIRYKVTHFKLIQLTGTERMQGVKVCECKQVHGALLHVYVYTCLNNLVERQGKACELSALFEM